MSVGEDVLDGVRYSASWDSLRRHRSPGWFDDAKLGVLIQWGPSSVPAWAPVEGDVHQLLRDHGSEFYFAHNPYAEWYANSIRIDRSPAQLHHLATYGRGFPYADFAPMFNAGVDRWVPDDWADLLAAAGVRYAVFVAKHHDGFLLWPSDRPNPHIEGFQSDRDIAGDVCRSLRARGMHVGIYYSGGLDWTFSRTVIRDFESHFGSVIQDPSYAAYADAHWRELIDRYEPDILWGDIGYPAAGDLPGIFSEYYNRTPTGVVNDRFAQELPRSLDVSEVMVNPTNRHFDFVTPEYSHFADIREGKWECTRGIGLSYAFNQNETEATHLTFRDLVHLLVDVVSKNGNLQLGVGPMADGSIPSVQEERLRALGGWLTVNGEAIYGTRPWVVAQAQTREGIELRYTRAGDVVYAFLLESEPGAEVSLPLVVDGGDVEITLVGSGADATWTQSADWLVVHLPVRAGQSPAHVLRIAPASGASGASVIPMPGELMRGG
jgi:alpha-L-fucosidase